MTTSPARRRRACARLVMVAPARRLAPRIPTTSVDVIQPDRLVDRVEYLGADRHVVRRETAAPALVLEFGVEPLGELLIQGRVADEARVELDRLVQQRGQ